MKKKLIILGLLVLVGALGWSQTTLIENINIIDVETGKLLPKRNVLIDGEFISKISSRDIKSPEGTTNIDGTGKYLIPGMIDTHIHFFQSASLYTRPDAIDLRHLVSYEDEMTFAEAIIPGNFRRYLRLGVTSIMDVGGPFSNFKVRDSMASKHLSPNVYVTGPLFSPYQPEAFASLEDIPIAKIRSIDEATDLFNKMLPYKPDFIKIWGVVTDDFPAEKNYPIVEHIAKLTHQNNLKLAVHATNLNTAKLAVKAGADILVHSVDDKPVDDEFIQLLKTNNVTYIPTLIVSKNYVKAFLGKPDGHPQDLAFGDPMVYRSLTDMQKYSATQVPPYIAQYKKNETGIMDYYRKVDSIMQINLKLLSKANVNIATGTDAGNIGTVHASSYIQEIEAMNIGGLSPFEILQASTINAATGFGLEASLGSVTSGKLADLVILDNNPLTDVQNLNNIHTVIKSGVALEIENLIEESPEQLVQRQVNAYNSRDIDAFMDTYADDIKIYNFPEELSLEGKEKMREQFKGMFERVPNLYCEIKNRIVLGNKVIDREYVRFGEQFTSVIAVYEIENGKIAKVTFIR